MQEAAASSTAASHSTPWRAPGERWLVPAVFFVGFWAYVWLVIKPRLIYDAFGIYLPYPEFTLDGACFRDAWSRVAGPLEYVSAFLSQWFSLSFLGALIVTAAAGLIWLGTDRLVRDVGGIHARALSLLPALAVLILYQTYHHPLDAILALALCLWLAVGYQTLRGPGWLRVVVFLVMCAGLYYLAGTVCLLFGLLIGTWCGGVRRLVIARAGAILVSAVVPWLVGTRFFYMTAAEAYSVAWPFGPGATSDMETWPLNVLRGLFLLPWVLVLAVAFLRILPRGAQERWQRLLRFGRGTRDASLGDLTSPCDHGGTGTSARYMEQTGQSARSTFGFGSVALRAAVGLLVLAAAVAAIHQFLRAPHREHRFAMVQFTHQRQWDQVLRAARQAPASSHDCFYRHLVNRALYHTGRLGDDLFSFSQDQAGLLLLTSSVPHGAPKFWMLAETAWELGDVNVAEQWTFERLEAVGECPSALEMLAMICLAKDRPHRVDGSAGREAARVVLNRMTKNVIQGRRAKTLLGLLDEVSPAGDAWLEDIDRVRALRCTADRVHQTDSEEAMLQGLLQANPRNQMAFEYLMACYLITQRTDKLVANLHRLDDFGCREIPRHYEEAILIHSNQTARPVELHGRTIRPETRQRFQAFIDRVRPLQNQPRRALGALAGDFGDSYFYYYAFGVSGTGGRR